ncbi:MAG: glycosyltransferase family 39 protein [Chitinophagales bacterium]
MNSGSRNFLIALLIFATGTSLFFPFLGSVHLFDWDEINFAESAREMLVTGNYARVQIDYQPFWEKPPLFFWLQAASMHLFGVNEFAARFPNAVFGIITLLTFFFAGRKLFDTRFGIFWVLCMLGSILPFLYFKSGIIDPVFNYFIFAGFYFLILLTGKNGDQSRPFTPALAYPLLSGMFIGLATLTKGPVALLILMITWIVYWMSFRLRKIISLKHLLFFGISYMLTTGIWFLIVITDNGIEFFRQFIAYHIDLLTHPVAGHRGPLYYHFVIVLLGCFPMSVVALPAIIKGYREKTLFDFKRWMLILFWVVLILFTIVKTKIVHYSSLAYFPLSFLAAYALHQGFAARAIPGWVLFILTAMSAFFSLLLFAAPLIGEHKEILFPYLKDQFAIDCLLTDVLWKGWEKYIGILYFLLMITAVICLYRKYFQTGITLLFAATAFCLLIYFKAVVPKIESYSQGPAIHFYQSLRGKHVYVATFGFKSYAQYFYFRKPPGADSRSSSQEWLLKGNIDRPAYFIVKTTSMKEMEQFTEVRLIGRGGGFAFYLRNPVE